jgi:hypothetical protein
MSINALRKKVDSSTTPGDLVLAILQEYPSEKITTDQLQLDRIFYELSQIDKYKKLLKDFVFDLSDFSPRCRMLETILDSLSAALKLETININAKEYRIKKSVKEPSMRKYISDRFDAREQKLIKEMARKLADELKKAA